MVVKLEIYEDKEKTKAMNAVSRLSGLVPVYQYIFMICTSFYTSKVLIKSAGTCQ